MKNRIPIYFNLFVIVCIDIILLGASWYSAFLLRFNFDIPVENSGVVVRLLPVVILGGKEGLTPATNCFNR